MSSSSNLKGMMISGERRHLVCRMKLLAMTRHPVDKMKEEGKDDRGMSVSAS